MGLLKNMAFRNSPIISGIDWRAVMSREKGLHGEDVAARYLRKKGYTVLARNYYSRYGEIDIIVMDQDCLVFCEVKTFKSRSLVSPLEAISEKKIQCLSDTAQCFVQMNGYQHANIRFDLVVVGNSVVLQHLRNIIC